MSSKWKYMGIGMLLLAWFGSEGQHRLDFIKSELELLIDEMPGLNETVDVSVSGVPLGEYLTILADVYELNIDVGEGFSAPVANNFSNVTVLDALLYLIDVHDIGVHIYGNIIALRKRPGIELPVFERSEPVCIGYSEESDVLTLDLEKDTLLAVAKRIVELTGQNIVVDPVLRQRQVSGFFLNVPVYQGLSLLGASNGFDVRVDSSRDSPVHTLFIPDAGPAEAPSRTSDLRYDFTVELLEDSLLRIQALGEDLEQVIKASADKLGISYFLYEKLQGQVRINVEEISFTELLDRLIKGTKYTYYKRNGIFFIGPLSVRELSYTSKYHFIHRTAEEVMEVLPTSLASGIEIKLFKEQNAWVMSGAEADVQAVSRFLEEVDLPVPMVFIEVMIVDYNRNNAVSAGVQFGVGEEPAGSGGLIFPEADYVLNGTTLNSILQGFAGFGAVNLGGVSDHFYMTVQALETNGIVKIRSTPSLSTLNGHPASLRIGSTEYYVVENSNIVGVQNPQPIITRQYESVQADLAIEILPIVSGDDQVTLDITVSQSDFTARIAPEAPPGQVNRTFTSMIRVKNEDVVLLGGLEEKFVNDTGSGVPLLSRIPIIKWFFSKRNRSAGKTKLNVFIKPTVLR